MTKKSVEIVNTPPVVQRDDSAALALHSESPFNMSLYTNVCDALTGEQISPELLSVMQIDGGTNYTNMGFVPPLAGTQLMGRIESIEVLESRYANPSRNNAKEQVVLSVRGFVISYNGDTRAYQSAKTDPLPPKGEDPKAWYAKHYSLMQGTFKMALMSFCLPLEKASVGDVVQVFYRQYEKLGDRYRKLGHARVFEGGEGQRLAKQLGIA